MISEKQVVYSVRMHAVQADSKDRAKAQDMPYTDRRTTMLPEQACVQEA